MRLETRKYSTEQSKQEANNHYDIHPSFTKVVLKCFKKQDQCMDGKSWKNN